MNDATGNINAQKLAAALQKGKPLSGEMKQIAEFASRFPKAAQPVEKMGSLPQVSLLDFASSAILSGLTSNPLMMATVLARPAARSLVLSSPVQNRLAQAESSSAFSAPEVENALARLLPLSYQFGQLSSR